MRKTHLGIVCVALGVLAVLAAACTSGEPARTVSRDEPEPETASEPTAEVPPDEPLTLPAGFWPLDLPPTGSTRILEPEGSLYVYDVVQPVNEDTLCASALRAVAGSNACAGITPIDPGVVFEPAMVNGKVHLMPFAWDFRVVVVAPESCYVVDVRADPEAPLSDWFTVPLRVGLRFGTSSLAPDDPTRCPEGVLN